MSSTGMERRCPRASSTFPVYVSSRNATLEVVANHHVGICNPSRDDVALWFGTPGRALPTRGLVMMRGCCKTTLKKQKSLYFLKQRLSYVHKIL